jgi:polyhydroxyalkanoate synthase
MLEDIARNGGLPAQVDKKGFRVGENLAASPGAVVFRNDMLELIQYEPRTEQVHSRPLLIVPPQINKFYLFDLAPGRSLIEFLTSKGIQVFALSWRNPTSAHRGWGLERYVSALLEAIDAVREITGNEDINLAAACSGGITASLLLALLAARGDRRVHTATLLVTVLDTSTESQIRSLVTTKPFR